MSYATNCPRCGESVATDEHTEIRGKRYPLFRCPRCTERLGVGRQSAARRLAFVVDAEGRVRRLAEMLREDAAG